MSKIPGKTRAELDVDYKTLMEQVEEDAKILAGYQRRNRRLDRGDWFVIGFLSGGAAIAAGFLLLDLFRHGL